MPDIVIQLEHIGKQYRRYRRQKAYRFLLKTLMHRGNGYERFWALQDINLTIYKGESVGIIGENGSGKSTLLKILSNVTKQTTGRKIIYGKVLSLLELGAGFHPYLTGKENIYLNGTLIGMKKKDIDATLEDIVAFSGLEAFIDVPIKKYSSGMLVRLGFSIMIHMNPDILLIDEVLAVGDEDFQQKCKEKIKNFHRSGKTILFVSHDLGLVRELCSRVYWLLDGRIRLEGDKEYVTAQYFAYNNAKKGALTIFNRRISLLFDNGKMILFWRGIELTKNYCIHGMVEMNQKSYHMLDATWEIIGYGDNHLRARTYISDIMMCQTWNIEINENRIIWSVEMAFEKRPQIPFNVKYNCTLTDQYKKFHIKKLEVCDGRTSSSNEEIVVESFEINSIKIPAVSFRMLESPVPFKAEGKMIYWGSPAVSLTFMQQISSQHFLENNIIFNKLSIGINDENILGDLDDLQTKFVFR